VKTRLTVLNGTGDTKITWDHSNPEECAEARKTVADLKAAGYVFFLVDGSPADEVASGAGLLIVRKMKPEELTDPGPELVEATAVPEAPEPAPAAKRRGRPPKARTRPETPDQNIVAVRPMNGG